MGLQALQARVGLAPLTSRPLNRSFLEALADGKYSTEADGPDTPTVAAFLAVRRVSALSAAVVALHVEAPKRAVSWRH